MRQIKMWKSTREKCGLRRSVRFLLAHRAHSEIRDICTQLTLELGKPQFFFFFLNNGHVIKNSPPPSSFMAVGTFLMARPLRKYFFLRLSNSQYGFCISFICLEIHLMFWLSFYFYNSRKNMTTFRYVRGFFVDEIFIDKRQNYK